MMKLRRMLKVFALIPLILLTTALPTNAKTKSTDARQSYQKDNIIVEAFSAGGSNLIVDSIEIVFINQERVNKRLYSTFDHFVDTYEVEFNITSKSGIMPLTSNGGNQTNGGITAYITIDYQISGTTIKFNSVYGGWTPSDPIYYVTDREVIYGSWSAFGDGYVDKKYPTSNSYSYSPSWGYIPRLPNSGYTGTSGACYAKGRVYEMAGTVNLEVRVTI